MWFEIITWPGTLTIGGDMGTWVFSRIEDMFRFFRREDLSINPSYWAEKLEAHDVTTGPAKKFSPEVFERSVIDSLDNYDLHDEKKGAIIAALKEEVFREEHEHPIREALNNFECDGFSMSDTWEISGREWGYRFLWCLYAIVWGIQQFEGQAAAERRQEPEEETTGGVAMPKGSK
jgi:hypothetical protein